MESPKVSIITVVLNGVETIEGTIKSVLSQDYKGIEYIIVDGGSTDGTLDILKKYHDRIQKYISEPDDGIYNAMNKGVRLSSGDIVATLNGNDVYANRSIVGEMIDFIENRSLDAAYGDLVYVDKGDLEKVTRVWRPGEYKKGAFRYGWVIPHPTFFCRKQIFEKYGYLNEKFQVAADFELLLRFIEKHQIKVGYLSKVIVKMQAGGKANVLRGMIRGNREIIKSFRLNGLRLSPWFFVCKPLTKISQLFARPTPVQ